MAQQAEAGDVGHGMDAVHGPEGHADLVELGGGGQHGGIARGVEFALLEGGTEDADPQGLAEDERIAGLGAVVALDPLRGHQTHDRQAVDGLGGIDGVAPGQGNAGIPADGGAPSHDLPHHADG